MIVTTETQSALILWITSKGHEVREPAPYALVPSSLLEARGPHALEWETSVPTSRLLADGAVWRWQVEFGYPFVAQTLDEMLDMLEVLRNSAALRQEASRTLLTIAKYLSVRCSLPAG